MRGCDDANVHADPASLVLSGRVRGPGQVDRVQLGEALEIFAHMKNSTPHAIENGKLGSCAGSGECSVRGIHKVPDCLPLVRLFQRTEADLIFCGSSEMDDPHFFALLRGEGAHGKVQWGDAGAFSGGAEFQKHSHIVGLGLYDRFEIAHGDEVSSELTGDVCGVV